MPLSHIELLLSENLHQALMISIDITKYSIQLMFSNFQCKNHNRESWVMGRMISFIRLELSGGISYHFIFLLTL